MPASSLQFLEVADWLPDPLLLVQTDGLLLAVNRAATRTLGLTDAAMRRVTLQQRCHGDAAAIAEYLRQSSRSRVPHPRQLCVRGPNDERMEFRAAVGVFRPARDGQPARLLVRLQPLGSAHRAFHALNERIGTLSREIERRRQAEAARRRLEAQMVQTQKMESIGVLAGGIAHDFNNILSGILGYCDLARCDLAEGTDTRAYLDEAINGARQAAELTQQLLAYAGKGKFVVAPVTFTDLVERTTRLLNVSISKKCVLRFDLMPNQPSCLADASQLQQVVMNLIINASDAIGENSGVISVTTGAAWCDTDYLATAFAGGELREGLYATLEVTDTGTGMSPETQARIFDPFFTTKFTGRGLGLAAVLGIVRSHGGAIRVYSEVGRGTTFKLLMPATAESAAHDELPSVPPPVAGEGLVIVADDEERVRSVARHMLVRMGYEVMLAADGREAVALYAAHRARDPLLLLDLTMPHLDGSGALRDVRRLEPSARVILMSGYSEQAATGQFVGRGAVGFIQKPFRYQDLVRIVASATRTGLTETSGGGE